ncbi:hypothetical protein FGSG_11735 [Fusarium graminearum PH-1]|uniref:Chromosome 1, complete genome n=1 Tax=Gibberella zeae (strain ATCC MYA-4620 / CBS 123657 / FGSC 9075 / NRRL 31084 / PH-1) TaxID=229533 RepID=I1S4G8_GIBZE|nr:hypothetical protein FGSG_11735 [Fusarium graminearum PH-1]ESU05410.1 hypothetical protein FGSG_11735 [Fusarium graminearum PH-1]CEF72145.1 unnamed protein product [Fusarium graminearum]|eukprot:XP_011315895.1 hypothetical protein FGSG_11735 [Fusarium graminearum PH-1]
MYLKTVLLHTHPGLQILHSGHVPKGIGKTKAQNLAFDKGNRGSFLAPSGARLVRGRDVLRASAGGKQLASSSTELRRRRKQVTFLATLGAMKDALSIRTASLGCILPPMQQG